MKNLIIAIIVIILIVVGVLYFVKKDGAEMIDDANSIEVTGDATGENSFTTGDAVTETMPATDAPATGEMEATQ